MVSGHLQLLHNTSVQFSTSVGEVNRRRSTFMRSRTDYCWWMTSVFNLKLQMCFQQQNHSLHMWTYLLFSGRCLLSCLLQSGHDSGCSVSLSILPPRPLKMNQNRIICLVWKHPASSIITIFRLDYRNYNGFSWPWPELVINLSPSCIPAFSICLFLPYKSLKMGLSLL